MERLGHKSSEGNCSNGGRQVARRKRPSRTQRIADFTASLTRISRNTSQDRLQKARIRQVNATTQDRKLSAEERKSRIRLNNANVEERQLSIEERKSRIRLNDARIKKLQAITQDANMRYCPKCDELFNPANTPRCKTCGSQGVKINVNF